MYILALLFVFLLIFACQKLLLNSKWNKVYVCMCKSARYFQTAHPVHCFVHIFFLSFWYSLQFWGVKFQGRRTWQLWRTKPQCWCVKWRATPPPGSRGLPQTELCYRPGLVTPTWRCTAWHEATAARTCATSRTQWERSRWRGACMCCVSVHLEVHSLFSFVSHSWQDVEFNHFAIRVLSRVVVAWHVFLQVLMADIPRNVRDSWKISAGLG